MNTDSMTEARRAGIFVEGSGKDFQAPCRSDMVAVRKDYAAPTVLVRIELKIPIKFSTRFGNGRILRAVGQSGVQIAMLFDNYL
jgi:hypothetical protein